MDIIKIIKENKIIIIILIIAIFLRIFFFTGLTNALPQDDSIYNKLAYKASINSLELSKYKNLEENYNFGPQDTFSLRILSYLPTSIIYKIFGVNGTTTSFWCFLCSIGTITLVYFMGKEFFSKKTGLIAAFLVSIFPLNIISSTRIISDVPLLFFCTFSSFIFLKGIKEKNKSYIFLSGILLGLGYLVKFTAVLFIGIYVIFLLLESIKKNTKYFYFIFILGFGLIIALESSYLFAFTGNPFLRQEIVSEAWFSKYSFNGGDIEELNSVIEVGRAKIIYDPGTFLQHTKTIFGLWTPNEKRTQINYFGYFYFLIVPSVIFFSYKIYKEKNKKYLNYFFLIWIILLLIYFDFGFLKIDQSNGFIRYFMLFKAPRFLNLLTPASMLILAWFINPENLSVYFKKNSKIITLIALSFLLLSSIYFTQRSRSYILDGMSDLKIAYKFIENSEKKVYTDPAAANIMKYLSGYKKENIYVLDDKTKIKNGSLLILGGSRSIDISGAIPIKDLPEKYQKLIRKETEPEELGLRLLKEVENRIAGYRSYKLRIYEKVV